MTPEGNGIPTPVEVPITRQVNFLNVHVNVGRTPEGNRILQIIDPGSATAYVLELDGEDARKVGSELMSTVPVAKAGEMPG